eukprot:CAMPEP_0171076580 /NCGR_PEP_ID=MMETSP0766_2-20121228/13511_1 /TAXON_ID=439317 /ORGANISM="Gambierdiscus australes, Strain CAWD 149" /LENGTH=33 /DNA_ID= /DNA_START= /DNA_END= /DNA_ORIENTATION=
MRPLENILQMPLAGKPPCIPTCNNHAALQQPVK